MFGYPVRIFLNNVWQIFIFWCDFLGLPEIADTPITLLEQQLILVWKQIIQSETKPKYCKEIWRILLKELKLVSEIELKSVVMKIWNSKNFKLMSVK